MKKILWIFLLIPVLLLPGCGQEPRLENLTGLTFRRDSGSTWGNQLYISLTQSQILTLRYIPAGTDALKTLEQLPITPEQWQTIVQALEQLPLERAKKKPLEKLFAKQDGSDYRLLTLTYGTKEISYRWPAGAEQLEALLEQLTEPYRR